MDSACLMWALPQIFRRLQQVLKLWRTNIRLPKLHGSLQQSGLSLVELMVVCAIVGILTTIATVQTKKFIVQSADAATRIAAGTVRTAVSAYVLEKGLPPPGCYIGDPSMSVFTAGSLHPCATQVPDFSRIEVKSVFCEISSTPGLRRFREAKTRKPFPCLAA